MLISMAIMILPKSYSARKDNKLVMVPEPAITGKSKGYDGGDLKGFFFEQCDTQNHFQSQK